MSVMLCHSWRALESTSTLFRYAPSKLPIKVSHLYAIWLALGFGAKVYHTVMLLKFHTLDINATARMLKVLSSRLCSIRNIQDGRFAIVLHRIC